MRRKKKRSNKTNQIQKIQKKRKENNKKCGRKIFVNGVCMRIYI